MRHHYNLIAHNTGPLVRDCPVYDSGIIKGQGLTYGADELGGLLIDTTAQGTDWVGLSNEAVSASSAVTTGTLVFAKVILNPDSIYLALCDPTASVDVDVVSSTSTATTLGTCDDDFDGSWLYCNSGTGAGQLAFIGAASATVMTLDTTDAWVTTPDSTTDVVIVRRPWNWPTGSGRDLDTTFSMLLSDEDETGEFLVMENYISSGNVPFGPLRPRQHHMLTGLNGNGVNVKLYSDIYPTDNIFHGATTMATS